MRSTTKKDKSEKKTNDGLGKEVTDFFNNLTFDLRKGELRIRAGVKSSKPRDIATEWH